jgi:hypothetical protein
MMMTPSLEAHGKLALPLGAEVRERLQPPCRAADAARLREACARCAPARTVVPAPF